MLRQLAEYAEALADWKEADQEEDVPDEVADADRPDGVPGKANIVTKTIDGNQYYYYQWWEDGKTKSEYLSPVNPKRSGSSE
ncbi:hypothetical protein [Halomarina oriensis]|nr:hypothetical protein [Halomarina oriensis]